MEKVVCHFFEIGLKVITTTTTIIYEFWTYHRISAKVKKVRNHLSEGISKSGFSEFFCFSDFSEVQISGFWNTFKIVFHFCTFFFLQN